MPGASTWLENYENRRYEAEQKANELIGQEALPKPKKKSKKKNKKISLSLRHVLIPCGHTHMQPKNGRIANRCSACNQAVERSVQLFECTECVVCLDSSATCALIACGHYCVCEDCVTELDGCPICRNDSRRYVRVLMWFSKLGNPVEMLVLINVYIYCSWLCQTNRIH